MDQLINAQLTTLINSTIENQMAAQHSVSNVSSQFNNSMKQQASTSRSAMNGSSVINNATIQDASMIDLRAVQAKRTVPKSDNLFFNKDLISELEKLKEMSHECIEHLREPINEAALSNNKSSKIRENSSCSYETGDERFKSPSPSHSESTANDSPVNSSSQNSTLTLKSDAKKLNEILKPRAITNVKAALCDLSKVNGHHPATGDTCVVAVDQQPRKMLSEIIRRSNPTAYHYKPTSSRSSIISGDRTNQTVADKQVKNPISRNSNLNEIISNMKSIDLTGLASVDDGVRNNNNGISDYVDLNHIWNSSVTAQQQRQQPTPDDWRLLKLQYLLTNSNVAQFIRSSEVEGALNVARANAMSNRSVHSFNGYRMHSVPIQSPPVNQYSPLPNNYQQPHQNMNPYAYSFNNTPKAPETFPPQQSYNPVFRYQGNRFGRNNFRASRNMECAFCKNNNRPPQVYKGHFLKTLDGRTACPKLREYRCPLCNNQDPDKAHTLSYCPERRKRVVERIAGLRANCPNNTVYNVEGSNNLLSNVSTLTI